MDIFKLIFEHDLLLEQLSGSEDARNKTAPEMSLEDFMKPVQTYTKYYFSGTRLNENRFGLTTLNKKDEVLNAIRSALGDVRLWTGARVAADNLAEIVKANTSSVIVASESQPAASDLQAMEIDDHTGTRDKIHKIKSFLDKGDKIIYLEKAHNGTDLHLFSKDNMYEALFYSLKPLIASDFRYFSINGKRMKGERMFYFETWTLNRPPHGFEEVTLESVV